MGGWACIDPALTRASSRVGGRSHVPAAGHARGRRAWRDIALAIVVVGALSGCAATPPPVPAAESVATAAAMQPAVPPTAVSSPPRQIVATPAQSAVDEALALAGTRYRYGGASPDSGFDCSGLIWYVYGRHGVSLPRVAARMAADLPVVDREDRRVGDLLFFNTRGSRWSHVAIYIGDDRFVHAPSARTGRVIVSTLKRPYWRRRLTGVRRAALPGSTS